MRTLQGTVVSAAMQKTVVVRVDRLKKLSIYRKYVRVSQRLKAHDERGEYRSGDVVTIQETRPMSREKRWRVIALVKRNEAEREEANAVNHE